ncbi:MAG: hypothetical protein KC645_01825, partial [Gemmatimonadetes bacterium]|nr:hypothetical protein [Gemmatimonadota bacterium]
MSRLRKLAAMRPAEIVERVTQALAVRRDRSLGSPRTRSLAPAAFVARRLAGGIDSAEALLARFRERPSRFFAGLDDPAATARALARVRPDAPAEARAEAEAVLAGRVRLFDRRWDVGLRPDWHVEPLSGVRYPQVHWSRIDYLDPAVGGEYKLIWELARQQQLLTLARAHAFDGEARWAEAALAHVEDWIHANPPGLGIHWASSLELAFRVQSWIWALHAFRGTPALTPERFARILAS